VLTAALALTGFLAGITGTWSPCGLSMIDTLAPGGWGGGRRASMLACALFALGALAGGVGVFAGLAALGELVGTGAAGAGVAAALALAAAVADLAGAPIVPQIRRQVPERWRRALPLPVAAALYGVLLGTGFTTFILTFAVWALAGIAAALGQVGDGVAVGLAFGAGRALPVAVLAPVRPTRWGAAAVEAMAMRPRLLRGLRLADGAALAVCALALAAGPAAAATIVREDASDPSVAGDLVALAVPGANGLVLRAGVPTALPGTDPAAGGAVVAWRNGDTVTVAGAADLAPRAQLTLPGAGKLAVDDSWLAWRARGADGGDVLQAQPLAGGAPVAVQAVAPPAQISRPALDGDRLAYAVAGPKGSEITVVDLRTGARLRLRGRRALVWNPTLLGGALLYVRTSDRTQQLRLRTGGRERVLYRIAATARRDRGYERGHHPHRRPYAPPHQPPRSPRGTTVTLWSTALSARAAYVTRLVNRRGRTSATVVRVRR
jgi:cytochrome c biogenesis protein CcdA